MAEMEIVQQRQARELSQFKKVGFLSLHGIEAVSFCDYIQMVSLSRRVLDTN